MCNHVLVLCINYKGNRPTNLACCILKHKGKIDAYQKKCYTSSWQPIGVDDFSLKCFDSATVQCFSELSTYLDINNTYYQSGFWFGLCV